MDGGNPELAESTAEIDTDIMGTWKGGGGCMYGGNIIHRGISGVTPIRFREMSRVPKD